MSSKTNDLPSDFIFETGNGCNGNDHHCQAERYSGYGDANNGTRQGIFTFFIESQAIGYKQTGSQSL